MRAILRILVAGMLLFAACSSGNDPAIGGDEGASAGSADDRSSGGPSGAGTRITLVAKDLTFDQTSLTVPAGEAFAVTLDNQDQAEQHNFAVYADDTAKDKLFGGPLFPGVATRSFDVPALDAGSYFFRCDVHPDEMTGSITAS